MIDERVYEFLYCQQGLANEEKSGLRKQVNVLIERFKIIIESNKENSKALVETINEVICNSRKLSKRNGFYEKVAGSKRRGKQNACK